MSNKQFDMTAFIYDKRGRIISIGKNSYVKTHPMQAEHAAKVGEPYKIFMHAEIRAITRCKNLDKAHSIRIMRYREDGTPGSAKPCKICMSAIKQAGIKHIEYT